MIGLDRADIAGLVSNRIATLLSYSRDMQRLSAQYVPKPMLAIAASMQIAGSAEELARLLEDLYSLLESGSISSIFPTGDAGEFAAAFLLACAHAWALATSSLRLERHYIEMLISVGELLCALIGRKAVTALGSDSVLLDSFTRVLQVVAVEESLSRRRILDAFRRGCAIACPRGKYAADLVAPVALGSERNRMVQDLRAKDMTAIFVQLKNWRQRSGLSLDEVDDSFGKIQTSQTGLPSGASKSLYSSPSPSRR